MLILLGILLGNVCAIAVNGFAWHLRRRYWWQLIGFGFGGLFFFCISQVGMWQDMRFYAQGDDWAYYHVWSKLRNPYLFFGLHGIFLLLVSGVGWLQSRQIQSFWCQGAFALCGELGLWFITLFAGVFILGDMPELCSALVIAFLITAAVLTFLRPVCLRWARPIWQVVTEMRTRKP